MSLKDKYRDTLVGFEKYSFSEEQICLEEGNFRVALDDLKACEACVGDLCRTSMNHRCSNPYWHISEGHPCTDDCYPADKQWRGYYALWPRGCRETNRPVFAVFACPGVERRKEQLIERLAVKVDYGRVR